MNSNVFKTDNKNYEINFFDNSYDRLYKDLLNVELNKQIKFLKKEINKDMNILDLCCGTVRHMTRLLKEGFNVSGIDINLDSLKKISKDINYQNHKTNLYNLDVCNEKINLTP